MDGSSIIAYSFKKEPHTTLPTYQFKKWSVTVSIKPPLQYIPSETVSENDQLVLIERTPHWSPKGKINTLALYTSYVESLVDDILPEKTHYLYNDEGNSLLRVLLETKNYALLERIFYDTANKYPCFGAQFLYLLMPSSPEEKIYIESMRSFILKYMSSHPVPRPELREYYHQYFFTTTEGRELTYQAFMPYLKQMIIYLHACDSPEMHSHWDKGISHALGHYLFTPGMITHSEAITIFAEYWDLDLSQMAYTDTKPDSILPHYTAFLTCLGEVFKQDRQSCIHLHSTIFLLQKMWLRFVYARDEYKKTFQEKNKDPDLRIELLDFFNALKICMYTDHFSEGDCFQCIKTLSTHIPLYTCINSKWTINESYLGISELELELECCLDLPSDLNQKPNCDPC